MKILILSLFLVISVKTQDVDYDGEYYLIYFNLFKINFKIYFIRM